MDDVETGVALDGLGYHFLVNVKISLQRRDEWLDMFQVHFCNNV
jgi:hypothetical protein